MAFLSCLSCLRPASEEITELDYRHNSLDDVPNHVFNLERTLEVLHLDSNNIRDLPRPLFHCHGLRHLGLQDNEVAVIPPAVSSLGHLVSLDVSRNVLTDIPENIKQCKQLSVLDASVNPLQKLPEGCTQLVSLTQLYLNDVFLEYLPANFGRMSKLRILELRENSLSCLPKSMSRLVNLTRIDLGQNQFEEMPEVLEQMVLLEEVWMDGNKLSSVPAFIGALSNLTHLDLSMNQLSSLDPRLGDCTSLLDLTLSTNDLRTLPERLGNLVELVTLKVDDNQLEALPASLGNMAALEELYCADNFLTQLPPSIGWLRKLHTFNADQNDLEELPPEIGSCKSMKILSVHANKLYGIPREVGHITNIAVLSLAGNNIPHLPLSFVKLKTITAIWLSENQTKPLVQLNPDTDKFSGEKVLTNFLLPQQAEVVGSPDAPSDSESWEPSAWESERSKRSLVKWAGEEQDLDTTSHLRRAPTPFPKEMRAMAKKAQALREKKRGAQGPTANAIRRKERELKPRPAAGRRNEKRKGGDEPTDRTSGPGPEIKSARVTLSPLILDGSRSVIDGGPKMAEVGPKLAEGPRVSPDKVSRDSGVVSPSDGGSLVTDTSDGNEMPGKFGIVETGGSVLTVHDAPSQAAGTIDHPARLQDHPTRSQDYPRTHDYPTRPLDHQPRVQEYPARTQEYPTRVPDYPPRIEEYPARTQEYPPRTQDYPPRSQDYPPRNQDYAGRFDSPGAAPVKAELVTNELDEPVNPPPYHIAAASSKHAANFSVLRSNSTLSQHSTVSQHSTLSASQHFYENQDGLIGGRKQQKLSASLERKSSFQSDGTFESISESETSTAPSSLQTIIRAPYTNSVNHFKGMSEYGTSSESSPSPTQVVENHTGGTIVTGNEGNKRKVDPEPNYQTSGSEGTDSEVAFSSANNLRKVSEQILTASTRSRSSVAVPGSRPGSIAVVAGSPRDQHSRIPGPASIQSSSSGSDSRPSSQLSMVRPTSQLSYGPRVKSPPNLVDSRTGLFAGPPNTVGLPPAPTHQQASNITQQNNNSPRNLNFNQTPPSNQSTPKFQSKLPRIQGSEPDPFPEAGLLSTISQAALSDDESPPATHVSSPPKFNTASLARPSPKGQALQLVQPNYENVQSSKSKIVNGSTRMVAGQPPGIPRPETRQVSSQPPRIPIPESRLAPGQPPRIPETRQSPGIPRLEKPTPVFVSQQLAANLGGRSVSPSSHAAALQAGMTQGQFRAAASQAKVSTIPEDQGNYLPMAARKGVMLPKKMMIPLATSSPSGIPTLMPNNQAN